jgi:hypothetical protein
VTAIIDATTAAADATLERQAATDQAATDQAAWLCRRRVVRCDQPMFDTMVARSVRGLGGT